MYGIPEPGDLAGQVVALGQAGGAGGRGGVVLGRGVGVAGHLEQVGADGVEPVVSGQPLRRPRRAAASPAAGPCTIAAATARLRVTTGLPVIRSSSPYRARICGQSVSSARAARSWTAAIAACSWYSPTAPPADRAVEQRGALGDQRPVPAGPVLLGQRDQLAAGAGAGRPAGVGEQHQREQAGHLGVVRAASGAPSGPAGSPRRTRSARCSVGAAGARRTPR